MEKKKKQPKPTLCPSVVLLSPPGRCPRTERLCRGSASRRDTGQLSGCRRLSGLKGVLKSSWSQGFRGPGYRSLEPADTGAFPDRLSEVVRQHLHSAVTSSHSAIKCNGSPFSPGTESTSHCLKKKKGDEMKEVVK